MNALPHINYRVAERDLKYYIFDWDDNILHMPTKIHLERRLPDGQWIPQPVSTSVFSLIRNDTVNYRPPGGNWEAAFVEFGDIGNGGESAFLRDTELAIRRTLEGGEKTAPSFHTFHRTLVEGRLFAIVTARGHDPEILKLGVRLFIDRVLNAGEKERMLGNLRGYMVCFDHRQDLPDDAGTLDHYLALNRYHAITSPHFRARLPQPPDQLNQETAKQLAVRDFVEHILRHIGRRPSARPVSVGFSDDDPANVAAVQALIKAELARAYPGVKFVVYDTSDPNLDNGRKVVVAGQLDLGIPTALV